MRTRKADQRKLQTGLRLAVCYISQSCQRILGERSCFNVKVKLLFYVMSCFDKFFLIIESSVSGLIKLPTPTVVGPVASFIQA